MAPPLPNPANINAAIDGMTAEGNNLIQSVQGYNTHQQALATELSLCTNYDTAQVLQQLAAIQASIAESRALNSAQHWNTNAKMRHSAVNIATTTLVVMRSVEAGPNPQLPINIPIPDFPATPDAVSQMTGLQCQHLLTSLDVPIPQGPHGGARQLRTAVREAIGLAAL